ncbi:hypothetical protein CVT26_012930 [Gymnopilus dilepis]|uniref:Uncharacterized protein n=1 Tax=Gymnopilus dilepis TaxID=231916 RepID=A0A409Y4A5_9AGAR|nr:hypothetical protein CVT26_012930 [Gymnopilus dilepis]
MGISHIHVVHKTKPQLQDQKRELVEVADVVRRDNSSCASGFYIAPTMGATVDSLQPLPITWDPSCLTSKEVDIYLYSPGSQYPRIHVWEGVALSRGTYTANIMPRWWNATATQSLQIIIVQAGDPPFLATYPGGPVFNATYTAPSGGTPAAADTTIVDSGITQVNDLQNSKKALTPGKKAAAALLPLLFIIGLCVAAYLKFKRAKGREKRKQWAEAVDKRMSTISTDWKSVSAAGANAAIRNSMAVGLGSRNSSAFGFGNIRPTSTYAVEGGEDLGPTRPMSQMRTGVGLRNPAALTSSTERVSRVSFAPDTRVSRVSFADGTRPSMEARRTRAFHSAYIPPVPALPADAAQQDTQEVDVTEEKDAANDADSDGAHTNGSFSPRQAQGALTLTPEDIRSRIAAGKARAAASAAADKDGAAVGASATSENSFAELMPALSMMRTGGSDSDDLLFPAPPSPAPLPPMPVSPPPASYPKPLTHAQSFSVSQSQSQSYSQPTSGTTTPAPMSPVMGTMPMQPMPASVMSPDEMLRAYAERKKSMAMIGGKMASISYPVPVASTAMPMGGAGNGMRVLYDANTGTVSPNHTGSGAGSGSGAGAFGGMQEDPYGGMSIAPGPPPAVNMAGAGSYGYGHHTTGSVGVGAYGGAKYAIGDDEHEHEYDEYGHAA